MAAGQKKDCCCSRGTVEMESVFLSFISRTFWGMLQEVSHEPQASSGQGEKDQQAHKGNLE